MARRIPVVLVIISMSLFLVCGGGGGGGGKSGAKFVGDDKELIEFAFPALKNPPLSADAAGVISGTDVDCVVPHDTDVTGLVAEYVSNGSRVEVTGVKQSNGVTANDFTSAVTYRVFAADGTSQDYTVRVSRAPSTEKKITSFSIHGVDGVIDEPGHTVRLVLPPHTDPGSLVATFSAVCSSVKVNGVDQVSGVTQNNFSAPVRYLVTADDGSTQEYVVTVEVALSTEKEITQFVFRSSDNGALGGDAAGVITGIDISVVLPYGTSASDLAAYFETSGASVTVNGVTQDPGVTRNDHTAPLTYRVTAEDGSRKDYTVSVTVAKNSAKELVQFTLDGEWGTIDGPAGTVSVGFSAGKDLGACVASFITTGAGVFVSGVGQESGVTVNDFNAPLAYKVRAEDGTERSYVVTALKMGDVPGMWNFESGAGPGYTVSGAVLVPSMEGNGLQFDGVDDYVVVPDSESLGLREAGSLEVIFKARSLSDFAGIVHKGESRDFSDEAYSLQFWGSGVLRMILNNASGQSIFVDSSDPIEAETWYHVVAAWDAAALTLYVNGQAQGSTPNTIGLVRDSAGGLVIGAQLSDQEYNSYYGNLCLDGTIDRVVAYNRALDADEVLEHYNGFFSGQGSSLMAYIPRVANVNVLAVGAAVVLVLLAIAAVRRFGRREAST